jgi:ectoine hydroxylase-related dioxygenase (phytanoyl-CoA dioxygenase family)
MSVAVDRLLTSDERAAWDNNGYLHLRDVVNADEVAGVRAALAEVQKDFTADVLSEDRAQHLARPGNDRDLNVVGLLRWTAAADALIDHRGTFGRVLGLMGPFIQVAGTEAFFRYASHEPLLGLHTDGGPALQRIFPEPASNVIQLKVQFFLTDVSQPDSGNLVLVPGSHRVPFPVGAAEQHPLAERRRQVLARAGDCVIFPWAMWHGVAPNVVGATRVSVIVRYAQLWCRPVDPTGLDEQALQRLTPRRRRLLGHFPFAPAPNDWYRPPSDQLDLLYGPEWLGSQEAAAYLAARDYFATIYRK